VKQLLVLVASNQGNCMESVCITCLVIRFFAQSSEKGPLFAHALLSNLRLKTEEFKKRIARKAMFAYQDKFECQW
jgi:hypothetical protein